MAADEQVSAALEGLSLRPQWCTKGGISTWRCAPARRPLAEPTATAAAAACAAPTAPPSSNGVQPASAAPSPACNRPEGPARFADREALYEQEDRLILPVPAGAPCPTRPATAPVTKERRPQLEEQPRQLEKQPQQWAGRSSQEQSWRGAVHRHRLHTGAPHYVPVKEWRSCEEVACNMEALPGSRLDQRLLSAAMQQMVTVRGHGSKRASDAGCFARLLALAMPRLASFDAFGLCIVVRTAARLGASMTGAQLRAWSEAAERRMAGFNTQDLANSMYSIGLLGLQLPRSARLAFTAAVRQRCGAMKPQELANTLLGLAYQFRGRHRDEQPPADVEEAAVELLQAAARRLHAMKHQELANAAWAFSKLATWRACEVCDAELCALFGEAAERAAHLPPQELSNLLLAQCNLRFFHPAALSALAAAAAHQARWLDEQHLDNVLLAVAHLPQHVSEAPEAPQQLRRCVDLADIAALRQELLRRLTTVERRIAGYTPTCEAICRALWALAALQCCTPEVWHAAMAALGRWHEAGSTDFAEGFAQLYDAQLLLAADGQHLELPPALHQRVQRAAGLVRQPATVSAWHEKVSAELRAACVEHRIEYRPEGAGHSLDIALPDERIAMEVDGPFHFTVNLVHGRHWPLGRTAARNRLIRMQGWRLVILDCWTWSRLTGSKERQAWLLQQLAAARQQSAAGCAD